MSKYISDADVKSASFGTPKFGPLGSVVDVRTYRRFIPEEQRRETFWERNQRVVNYNIGLAASLDSGSFLEDDAQKMFSSMNNFLAFSSGRTMWVGGTAVSDAHPAANFNCSFLAINRLGAFTTLFELLMLGTGVGFRVFSSDIDNLPNLVNKNLNVVFQEYSPVKPENRIQNTYFDSGVVYCGDSREGWIDALRIYLDAVTNPEFAYDEIAYNFDSIRPMGERINGFGGTASGPDALKGIIADIARVIQECPSGKLRSIDCMDICTATAKGVVAGSSRRSALICLFEEGDELCANAKQGLYTDPTLAYKKYRSQSNNTECLGSKNLPELRAFLESNPDASEEEIIAFISQYKPSRQWLRERMQVIEQSAEPGFNNILRMAAKRWLSVREWRPECPVNEIWQRYCDIGTNPCHEIILSAGYSANLEDCGKGVSFCNLTTIPLQNFVSNGEIDWQKLEDAVRLTVRIGLRQTCVIMPRPELNDTQQEERLLGVSATGWRNMFDMLGWETGSIAVADLQLKMRYWANDEATNYAKQLGVKRPLLVTCIKPEGTSSKLFGSSDGLHWDWAPYYIRRIQMSTTDALAKALKSQGFPWKPTPYDLDAFIKPNENLTTYDRIELFNQMDQFDRDGIFRKSNAVLFEFPIKSSAQYSQSSVSAIEQLENVKSFAVNYTDHMPSSTVTVKHEEWDAVAEWIYNNWDSYVNCAFMSYFDGNYPLLPYEEISEADYNEMLSKFDSQYVSNKDGVISFVVDEEILAKFERQDIDKGVDIDDVELGDGCSRGACPLR